MDSDGENLEDYEAIEDNQGEDIQNSDREGDVNQDENADADGGEEDEDKQRKVIKPKRVVRNPQPKLNAETLKGPRGLTAMAGLFSKQKFKGKGHEKEDLRVLLKTYNYWCHRMFPKYPFDQTIDKIEKLGTKRPVITFLKKIRMGLAEEEEKELEDEDEEEQPAQKQVETNRDTEFDALLPPKPAEVKSVELTEEQLERIRINKEKALKLRQERLKKIQQQAESKLKPASVLPEALDFSENTQEETDVHSQNTESEINSQNTCKFNDMTDKTQCNDTETLDNNEKYDGNAESNSDGEASQVEEYSRINSNKSEIALSNKSSSEEDFKTKKSLSSMKIKKKNIPSSTMIQDEIIVDNNMESTHTPSDEDLSVLRSNVTPSENAQNNENSMQADNITIVSTHNKTALNIEKQTNVSIVNESLSAEDSLPLNIDSADNNENVEGSFSSNLNYGDKEDEGLNKCDGETESTDIIENTPDFIQNSRLNKNVDLEMDCD